MYSTLELSGSTRNINRRFKWPFTGGKMSGRRFVHQFIWKLPLLILWTIIVSVILFLMTSNSNLETEVGSSYSDDHSNSERLTNQTTSESVAPIIPQELTATKPHDHNLRVSTDNQSVHLLDDHSSQRTIDTTPKESSNDYVRLSKVFILIVRDQDHKSFKRNSRSKKTQYDGHQASDKLSRLDQHSLSPNIRLLLDILDSHRIDYVIDSTRFGLPTSLLIDQDSKSKQFSVIIIDDFIRYTKMNRWLRDQLDRICRSNQIGVITFLNSLEDENTTRVSSNKILSKIRNEQDSNTQVSFGDQFPIKLKLMKRRKACGVSSMISSITSNECLRNHQVNHLSPILRILKRKKSLTLDGSIIGNESDSPWVSMQSNHISYEPISWANFVRLEPKEDNRSSKVSSISRNYRSAIMHDERNTQAANYGISNGLRKDKSQIQAASLFGSQSKFHTGQPDSSTRPGAVDIVPNLSSEFESDDIMPSQNAHMDSSLEQSLDSDGNIIVSEVLTMFDRGLYDGIQRVIFGGFNRHWLNRILLLDSIEHLSLGQILTPLDRFIQIDIDDIFVGETGKRMHKPDVEALIEAQRAFSKLLDGGFKFNLGFSGKYFRHGNQEENLGDEALIRNAKEFTWFCHFWSHSKSHLFNTTSAIVSELEKNLDFASSNGIPIFGMKINSNSSDKLPVIPYAIAPHHSGVYPIHEQLYSAWRKVLNIQVTSTEEYPHLRPANSRRGFIYRGIKVLPRQTCGLYTHTIFRDKYPGGVEKLDEIINGGELFETVLHNPINIYMTHMPNYANDRLAIYTFDALFRFVKTYTNLELKFASSSDNGTKSGPEKLADQYFRYFPREREPLWTNPCTDNRHLAIWSPQKHDYCSLLPKLLIVGPQKTGTTALYTFLAMNPTLKSSRILAPDYEEIQFFNDKYYYNGIEWYLEKFNYTSGLGNEREDWTLINYDKSATYFDDPKVPVRVQSLIPDARIVILLVNPADRAYSWYQHMRAHQDPVALALSFEQIISSSDADPKTTSQMISLRNRCLHPGYYSSHLMTWLERFPSKQITIIDGEWFRISPASVMNRLQVILRLKDPVDYNRRLIYDQSKGFYCQLDETTNRSKCLGKSKGRIYEPMSSEAREFLNQHYRSHNKQLARLLTDIGQPLPNWLEKIVSSRGSYRSGLTKVIEFVNL